MKEYFVHYYTKDGEEENHKYTIHKKIVSKKTMLREGKGYDRCTVYNCLDWEADEFYDGYISGDCIITYLLK